ncbi:MAG: hypothetical protein HY918_04490 [Candidatus Doudnabacteria bacterium]|nr:hypothetical protein [Candidatus Doudnabacteria bacterium]
MEINPLLFQNLPHAQLAVYGALFLGMFVEANITILAGAVLISQRLFNPGGVVGILALGAFLEQFFYYVIGLFLARTGRLADWINKTVGKYDSHFLHKTFRSLIVSKFVYGFHRAVLMRCGMLKIGFRKFLQATIKSTTLWLLIILSLGLAFGVSVEAINKFLAFGQEGFLAIFVLFFLGQYLLNRRLQKEL